MEYAVRIKEVNYNSGYTSYTSIIGKTKEEMFDGIYSYFKSYQYCNNAERTIEDENIAKEYHEWEHKNWESLWWKHASGRDFD